MKTEDGFREEFSFLSNFTYFEKQMVVRREGYVFSFPTNEHFYQACKFKDYEMIVLVSKHPSKGLKKFINSKKSEWRTDWDEIKLDVMETGLRYKFSKHNPKLRQNLLDTNGIELVEYNYWNDVFWGVCKKTEVGENHLGKLLMKIREEIIMKTEFNEEEFQKAVKILLDYVKRTNKDYAANLRMFPEIDLKPCKSCGRIVYVGKCCDNPDYEIEVIKEE